MPFGRNISRAPGLGNGENADAQQKIGGPPAVERSRIAIIVPALNEAATIGPVLARVKQYGSPIVVDDGSGDETAQLARAAGAAVVTHAVNQGYDAALNSGFAYAARMGCAYAITIDADGQHNP